MDSPRIRPLALCVFRKGDLIFVSEGYDPKKQETFYRPIGGGIEFGEQGVQAAAREVHEEIGAEVKNLKLLGTFENIFTFNGKAGHELVLLFQADFVDPIFYEEVDRAIIEGGKAVSTAMWKPLKLFLEGKTPIYPDGIIEVLKAEWNLR